MLYSRLYKKSQWTKNVVFALVAVSVAILSYVVVQSNLSTKTVKGSDASLSSVAIANGYPTQTTIIWQTKVPKSGYIIYGEKELDLSKIAYDERDNAPDTNLYTNHITTIKELKPDTRYFFRITSGDTLLSQGDTDIFSFTTIPLTKQTSNLKPAYGTIVDENSKPVKGAIVILTNPDQYSLATVTSEVGEWLIPLNFVVNKKTNKPLIPKIEDEVTLQILDESGATTKIATTFRALSPLPKPLALGTVIKKSSKTSSSTSSGTSNLTITYPKNRAVIPADSPLIKGESRPEATIEVALSGSSATKEYEVKADANGQWRLNVAGGLSPDSYSLIAKVVYDNSVSFTQSRSFTVTKSGTQVLGDATLAATISPTTSPTATPSATLTPPSTSITPTTIVQLTSTPEPTPEGGAVPTSIYAEDSDAEPPVAGANVTSVTAASIALIIFGAGLMLLF